MKKVYQSFDGKYHNTEFGCAEYERRHTDSKDIEVYDEAGKRIVLNSSDDYNTFYRKMFDIRYVRIKNVEELEKLNRLWAYTRIIPRPYPQPEEEKEFAQVGDYFKNFDYDMCGFYTKENFENEIADDDEGYYDRDYYNAAKHFFGWVEKK